jgi:hypothetical protein
VRLILTIFTIITALAMVEVDLKQTVLTLGVLSILMTYVLGGPLSNIASGFMLMLLNTVNIGDKIYIKIGYITIVGTVREFNLSNTVLTSLLNEGDKTKEIPKNVLAYIPNNAFMNNAYLVIKPQDWMEQNLLFYNRYKFNVFGHKEGDEIDEKEEYIEVDNIKVTNSNNIPNNVNNNNNNNINNINNVNNKNNMNNVRNINNNNPNHINYMYKNARQNNEKIQKLNKINQRIIRDRRDAKILYTAAGEEEQFDKLRINKKHKHHRDNNSQPNPQRQQQQQQQQNVVNMLMNLNQEN